jgi:hypothetical protein
MALPWCFWRIFGIIDGRDRVCLLQAGLCDVVKHEKQKL